MLRGCDPKKLLWGVAEAVDQARRLAYDGFAAQGIALSWPALMSFKRSFLEKLPEAVQQKLHVPASIRCMAALLGKKSIASAMPLMKVGNDRDRMTWVSCRTARLEHVERTGGLNDGQAHSLGDRYGE